MRYFVTHGHGSGPQPIDFGNPTDYDLEGALDHARAMIEEGRENVAIQDGAGHSISGDDLVACCDGNKSLAPDLRAVPN